MWKNRIGYLLLWICVFALYIFYVGYTSFVLFLLVSSMPVLSILYFILGMRRLEVRLQLEHTDYNKEASKKLSLYSKTNSFFPLARIQGTLHIENVFTQKVIEERIVFTSERNITEVDIPLRLEDCGFYTIQIERLSVYDLLGIVHVRKKCTSKQSLYVLPTPVTTQIEPFIVSHREDASYDAHKRGNDTGEIFDVHSYRLGDSLHKIHWKLSAKLDDIIVKDFSAPMDQCLRVAYELYGELVDVEYILGYVYGVSLSLLTQGYAHTIQRYGKGVSVSEVNISNQADLLTYMKGVLAQPATMEANSTLPDVSDPKKAIFYVKRDGLCLPQKERNRYVEEN